MSGQWTASDPGYGDPPSIRAAASARQQQAATMRDAAARTGAASATASAGWSGQGERAVVSVATDVQADLGGLASQVDAVAGALQRYANDVDAVKQQQSAIMARQEETSQTLSRARRSVDRLASDSSADPYELSRARGNVDALNWQMRAYGGQLEALTTLRSAADSAAIASLTGASSAGALAGLVPGSFGATPSGSLPNVTLEQLAEMTSTELAALFQFYPGLAASLRTSAPPDQVAAWWASLSRDAQTALVLGAPGLIGSLGGVSPVARSAANRLNAVAREAEIDARLAELRSTPTSGGFSSPAYGYDAGTFDEEINRLLAERGYLQKVIDGTVQLYLYDPSSLSIVEMIGTPGPETTAINTYIPGTFTSLFSFYHGDVQQVGSWLERRDAGQVTFVWKHGLFPGEDPATGAAQILPRILEANFLPWAVARGNALAGFESELRASLTSAASAEHNGIAHSWGLGALTASEDAGATYDTVISLSGAGMPPDWDPRPGTTYAHFAYTDALTMAQQTGAVWGGNNPGTSPYFQQHHYATPGDFTIVTRPLINPFAPGGPDVVIPMHVIPATSDPIGNHDLIATNKDANLRALSDVLAELQQ